MTHAARHGWFAWVGLGLLAGVPVLWADTPVQLRENFAVGYQYHVSTRTELSGTLSLPAEKGQAAPRTLPVTGNSAIEYDERVLTVDKDGQIGRAHV